MTRGAVLAARRLAIAFFEFVYPTTCRVCDGPIADAPTIVWRRENSVESLICEECRRRLVAPPRTFCRRCGRVARWERPDAFGDVRCPSCRRGGRQCDETLFFDELRPGALYRGLTRTVVLRLKRERDPALAEAFARLYFASRRRALEAFAPDCVVPVPMNWSRRLARGVNSPDVLAATLADALGVAFAPKLVRRMRATPPQSSIEWSARRRNVADAFRLGDCAAALSPKRVLLVDDVFTSGATANEIARILKDGGVEAVCVAALGRAGLGKGRPRPN